MGIFMLKIRRLKNGIIAFSRLGSILKFGVALPRKYQKSVIFSDFERNVHLIFFIEIFKIVGLPSGLFYSEVGSLYLLGKIQKAPRNHAEHLIKNYYNFLATYCAFRCSPIWRRRPILVFSL